MTKYGVIIYWSEEDEAFVVEFGQTTENDGPPKVRPTAGTNLRPRDPVSRSTPTASP
jgi:hypothetical protein